MLGSGTGTDDSLDVAGLKLLLANKSAIVRTAGSRSPTSPEGLEMPMAAVDSWCQHISLLVLFE